MGQCDQCTGGENRKNLSMILSKSSIICLVLFFVSAQSSIFMNPLRKTFSTAIDSTLIYEGIFSPENNLIVIIQNFYVWAVSSLGLLALIPFYQGPPATTTTILKELEQGRSFDGDYDYYGSGTDDFEWVSSQTLTDMTWMLRYIADWMERYNV